MNILLIIWIIMLFLSFIAATYFDGALAFCLLYFLIAVPIICLLYILIQYYYLNITQKASAFRLIAGLKEPYKLNISNTSKHFSCYNLKLIKAKGYYDIENLPIDMSISLNPGEQIEYNTNIICKYRGTCRLGIEAVKIPDFLGLFNIPIHSVKLLIVQVMPRIVYLNTLKSIPEFTANQRSLSQTQNEPDIIVRDYIEGDPLNRINWKSTARTGELKTRNLTGTNTGTVSVIVDTSAVNVSEETRLAVETKLLETVIAITRYFCTKNIITNVHYNLEYNDKKLSNRFHRIHNINDFDRFYEEISFIDFTKTEDALTEELLYNYNIIDSQIIIFVLSHLTPTIIEYIDTLTKNGTEIYVYLITEEEVALSNNSISNITYIKLEQDIREVL